MRQILIPALLSLLFPLLALAAIEVHEFESPEQQQRFEELTAELRCPKCQNQNIAASNAPIAKDMRDQVYERMQSGQTDEEIIDAMVERFGDFVHYRPPLTATTAFLWFGPVVLGLVGALTIVMIVRRSRRRTGPVLSPEERLRVDALMAESRVQPGVGPQSPKSK